MLKQLLYIFACIIFGALIIGLIIVGLQHLSDVSTLLGNIASIIVALLLIGMAITGYIMTKDK